MLRHARVIPEVVFIAVARETRLRVVAAEQTVRGDALRAVRTLATDGQFTGADRAIPVRPRVVAQTDAHRARPAVVS